LWLLLLCGNVRGSTVREFVGCDHRHGLSVGGHGHLVDFDHLAAALVGFFNGVRIDFFQRDRIGGIAAFVGSIGTVEFGGVTFARRFRHRDFIAIRLVGGVEAVVALLDFVDRPCARSGMDSGRRRTNQLCGNFRGDRLVAVHGVRVDLTVRILPSAETMRVCSYTTFPAFFVVTEIVLGSTSVMLTVSYAWPVTAWSVPSAFAS